MLTKTRPSTIMRLDLAGFSPLEMSDFDDYLLGKFYSIRPGAQEQGPAAVHVAEVESLVEERRALGMEV